MLNNTAAIMAQRYIPEIVHGDKRVLVINGSLCRMPWRAFHKMAKPVAIWPQAAKAWHKT